MDTECDQFAERKEILQNDHHGKIRSASAVK